MSLFWGAWTEEASSLRQLSGKSRRLQRIRKKTKDLILSPFKGNNKSGNRRRRLDYKLARGIIEQSLDSFSNKQLKLNI